MDAKRVEDNLRDANEAGVNLLMTDAEIALTFLDAAKITSDAAGAARKIREARRAYDSILHLIPRFTLSEEQSETLDERLSLLRERLRRIGAFES